MSNKIVINDGKKRDKKEAGHIPYEAERPQITTGSEQVNAQEIIQNSTHETEPIPVDENVWGNDYTILNKLGEKQLADRRLFVRVRHMQRVECHDISDNITDEPTRLTQPITFIISDLSMGGIGIICDHEIGIGKILVIPLVLDNILYEIKCEVVYCFRNDDKFRAGLKIVQREKHFIRHLKIFVARISLNSNYGPSR